MIAIICGGRDFQPTSDDYDWLKSILLNKKVTQINCGMAKGADLFGKKVGEELGLQINKFPADWNTYGKMAGRIRNLEMSITADLCIAFPGGKGTKHMVDTCLSKRIVVIRKFN